MSALELLQRLTRRGVAVQVRGTELILDGPVEVLTDELVANVRAAKSTLLAVFAARESPWLAGDWQAYFAERAAIRHYDGGSNREDAEQLAFEDCLERFLAMEHPRPEALGICALCGRSGSELLPIVSGGGLAHVHYDCHADWRSDRKQRAAKALLALGVRSAR